jgi:hypothetical protein
VIFEFNFVSFTNMLEGLDSVEGKVVLSRYALESDV